eukprot:SAG22_NODE_6454_length_853_cov_0.604775_3_plen_71_part_01
MLQFDGTTTLEVLMRAREVIATDTAFKEETARLAKDVVAAQERISELQSFVSAKMPASGSELPFAAPAGGI